MCKIVDAETTNVKGMKMSQSKVVMVLLLMVASVLSGCATPPTAAEIAKIDYGSYPYEYKKNIERYLDIVLKDPGSKQIEFMREPRATYSKASPMFGGRLSVGYAVCAYVNARNSYGGYTGAKLAWFLIKNDQVIQSFISSTRGALETIQAEEGCQSLT